MKDTENAEIASNNPSENTPVVKGMVMGTLAEELMMAVQEIQARRAFCADVVAWMNELKLGPAFEAWRAERAAQPPTS